MEEARNIRIINERMLNKVMEVNLEYGMPSADIAVIKAKSALSTYRSLGYKAVILIHGYGSSGNGGSIKAAVLKLLKDNSMRGTVRTYASGDEWTDQRSNMLTMCGALKDYERRIAGNAGVTAVVLK